MRIKQEMFHLDEVLTDSSACLIKEIHQLEIINGTVILQLTF